MVPDLLWRSLAALLASLWASSIPFAQDDGLLTDAEQRGREIYLSGESAGEHEITARFGPGRTPVPARALPCSGCHGLDGKGREEGGVFPPDVTWAALTRPDGVRSPSGRERGPYDESTLVRAITKGRDPGGAALANVMPTYTLDEREAADLVAYLRRLGTLHDPGITDETLRLGIVLPSSPGAEATRRLLEAYFDEVSARGGLHGRAIELVFVPVPAEGAPLEAYRVLLQQDVFALLASSLVGCEVEAPRLLEARGTPLVGAITDPLAVETPARSRYVFRLFADVATQGVALARARLPAGAAALTTAVAIGPGEAASRAADALARRIEREGWDAPRRVPVAGADWDLGGLVAEPPDAVFLLASGEHQLAFLDSARAGGLTTRVLVPGILAARELLDDTRGFAIEVGLPRGPSASDTPAHRELIDFLARQRIEPGANAEELVSAWCAARLITEALGRAGRGLSREGLVATLEGLYGFDVGIEPPLSFGPSRRVAARGAYVITLGPGDAGGERGRWVPAD